MVADVRSPPLRPARVTARRADPQGAIAARAAMLGMETAINPPDSVGSIENGDDKDRGSSSSRPIPSRPSSRPDLRSASGAQSIDPNIRIAELKAALDERTSMVSVALARVRDHIAAQQIEGPQPFAPAPTPATISAIASYAPLDDPSLRTITEQDTEHDPAEASADTIDPDAASQLSGPGRGARSRSSSLRQGSTAEGSCSTLAVTLTSSTPQGAGATRPSHAPANDSLARSSYPSIAPPSSWSTSSTATESNVAESGSHQTKSFGGRSRSSRPSPASSWKRASLSAAMAGAGRSLWRSTASSHLRSVSTASTSHAPSPASLHQVQELKSLSPPPEHQPSNASTNAPEHLTPGPATTVSPKLGESSLSQPNRTAASPQVLSVSASTVPSSPLAQAMTTSAVSKPSVPEAGASRSTQSTPQPAIAQPTISTGAVIRHLTNEVQAARDALASTKRALVGVQSEQRDIACSLGDAREARTRAEEGMQAAERMLDRRERLLVDARDRLRGAEHRARTLGAESRNKGTRLRELEAKLGTQRREAARKEAAYENLRTEWEAARTAYRTELAKVKADNAQDAQSFCAELEQHKARWQSLTAPSTTAAFAAAASAPGTCGSTGANPGPQQNVGKEPRNTFPAHTNDGVAAAVASLRAEQDAAARAIAQLLDPLVSQARALEERDERVEALLLDTLHEVRRLHRLALASPESP